MSTINILSLDAAMANIGMVAASYDLETGQLTPFACQLQATKKETTKAVRQSSDDVRRGRENFAAVKTFSDKHACTLLVGEVPSGAQSARAAFAFGMATMLLSAVSLHLPFVQVSPREVKEASVGSKNASKDEMIRWATERWPAMPWLRDRNKPDGRLLNDNEHLADACAIALAGIETVQFAQSIAMMRSMQRSAA